VKQVFLHERLERRALLEAPGELDVRILPQERTLMDTVRHPVADLRIPELLEGSDVALIGVLNVGEGVEGVHGETRIDGKGK
jgi:hypothetical protein